jgi:hypothetical protein
MFRLVNLKHTKIGGIATQGKVRFIISKHVRDRALLDLIAKYFNCGYLQASRDKVDFAVSSYKDIINIIIPFFNKYPLQCVKSSDYADFCIVALLMQDKVHMTAEGLEQIRKIIAEGREGGN